MTKLREAVEASIKAYDPSTENVDENTEFTQTESVSFGEMAFRYASGGDKFYMFVGMLFSFLGGASLPGFCFVFGEMIDDMAGGKALGDMNQSVIAMCIVACIIWVTMFFQVGFLSIFSLQLGAKIKIAYFESALKKDADFYDV